MQSVRTSYAAMSELSLNDAAARTWLSQDELATYLAKRAPLRRTTFLAGRVVLKQMLLASAFNGRPAQELTIESRSALPGHGERPVLLLDGLEQPLSLSIAHSPRGVLAVIGDAASVSVGVDLVARDSAGERLAWTFTPAERRWLAAAPNCAAAAEELWARKEAIYKACQRGEGFRPAAIEVVPTHAPSYPNLDPAAELKCLQTWRVDGHVAALAIATPRPAVALRNLQPNTRAA